jgi:galactonate dehydratase
MKITSVDIYKVTTGKFEVTGYWCPIVVRINTDEGISGFGEAGVAYGCGGDAAVGMIKDFAKKVIGKDPINNELIWNTIHRGTFWGMGGGTIIFSAISAIDIALWDIKGKYYNTPVYKLLGGKTNSRLRAYASQIQFDWAKESRPMITPEDYAEATRKAIADGYNCVKVDPVMFDDKGVFEGWSTRGLLGYKQLEVASNRVAAIRETGGPEMDIIIELHSLTDADTAVQLGRELEKYRCFYYEEPTQPLNSSLFKIIAQKVNIPIASGERLYSRWGYRPFFEDRTLSVIQPDLCNTGGITEGKKICDMAHVYDMGVQIHICGGPISTAASLQLEAVIPNFVIHEHHQAALIQQNIDTCKYDYQPAGGYFEVPELPGIGQELTKETMKACIAATIK